jgi:hypothetical protein
MAAFLFLALILFAQEPQKGIITSPVAAPNISKPRYPTRTFFPGTTDPSKAESVQVKSGTETGGLNFAIQTLETVNVSGRIVNPYEPAPTQPPPGQLPSFIAPPTIALVSQGSMIDEAVSAFGNNATAAERQAGVFKFSGVFPGMYDLVIVAGDGGPSLRAVGVARIPVLVRTQDVTGIVVNVRPPVDVKGRIINDGQEPLNLRPAVQFQPIGNKARSVTPPKTTAAAGGEFTIPKVHPGWYAIDVDSPEDVFVSDLRLGERSIMREAGIAIGSESPDLLQIVVSRNGGRVRGQVRASPDQPSSLSDTTVVLIPEPSFRANPLLYRFGRASEDGSFELKNIVPGNYKLFAWDAVLPTAWMNAEFLKLNEDRGVPLPVKRGEILEAVINAYTPAINTNASAI